ncbi:MAG: EAL domain-containing protein [Venatoribacter sp.]
MGHRMGLRVIAEGVETAAQLAYLAQHRCDQMQGFYFSRPVPAQGVLKLFEKETVS